MAKRDREKFAGAEDDLWKNCVCVRVLGYVFCSEMVVIAGRVDPIRILPIGVIEIPTAKLATQRPKG